MHNWIDATVSAGVRVILLFYNKIFQRVQGEKLLLKNLWIFLKQTTIWPGDFLLIFIACFMLLESNSLVKTISISPNNDFIPNFQTS